MLHLIIIVIELYIHCSSSITEKVNNTEFVMKDEFWNLNLFLNYVFWS